MALQRTWPFLHGYVPTPGALTGYVIEDDGWYWTGANSWGLDPAWSRNPRRALVFLHPLEVGRYGYTQRGRCVEVLLEDEVTMLPLRHWPR